MNRGLINKIRRSCLGKVKHTSFTSADYALYSMKNWNVLEIYKCNFCKKFHIGHIKTKKHKHNSVTNL